MPVNKCGQEMRGLSMTDKGQQIRRAKLFQDLHQKGNLFVLANIWNVGSAVIFEKEGGKANAYFKP